jgi:hypothetical protein
MRLSSSWRFTCSASFLTTTILLCLGVFLLSRPAGGFEVSAVSTMAGAPHAEQAANWHGYSIDENYLAAIADDDEPGQQLPKNAALLRTLVIVLFVGLALRWLLASSWRRRRPEVCLLIGYWFHSVVHLHQRRAVATLLGVFLL